MEIAFPSAVMKQPNMESDPADAWYAFSNMQKPRVVELQEVVSHEIVHPQEVLSHEIFHPQEVPQTADAWYAFSNMQKPPVVELQEVVSHEIVHPQEVVPHEIVHPKEVPQTEAFNLPPFVVINRDQQPTIPQQKEAWAALQSITGPLSDTLGLLLPTWKHYLSKLGNSKQILYPDDMNLIFDLMDLLFATRNLVRGAERNHDFLVKLWVADTREVLSDMEDILIEIIDANSSCLPAELKCSANKPWKLILNLFNKVSRFMHYYRDEEMASKVRDITARIQRTFEGAISSGRQSRLSTEDKFEPQNLGRKQYDMLNAIYKGKIWKVRDVLGKHPEAIATIFENGQTALHVAITAGQLRIAKELIVGADSLCLEIRDEGGNTTLSLAARSGMMEIAKCLIERNSDLLTIPDANNKIPVQLACSKGHEDMTRYLYRNTPPAFLNEDRGFYLLEKCITKKMFDIALHLLYRFPKFAIYKFFMDKSRPIISTLAETPPPLFRGNQLAFWRRWIYKWIRVKADKGSVLPPSDGVEIFAAQRSGTLVSILPNFLAKQTYDIKLMDVIAHEIIHFICKRLSTLDEDQFKRSGAVEATFEAIENGNPDIVIEITKVNKNIWNHRDFRKRNLLACAVVHRQEEVAQFLYGFNARIGTNIVFTKDRDGNNLLHLAAMLAPRSHLDRISGAALQLQSELRWYKAVEGIVPQFFNYQKNAEHHRPRTPSQVFADEHGQLLKEAEEWLKKTAESSTVVGALIITIMFAVAFTVPGGNDQNTGFPIFLNKTANSSMVSSPTVPFMVFVASDAMSLFAASSSVLMFLGILTSRYAYEDFLKSLPVKLIIGISSLFISIAAMMVAFCVALFIMLQGRLWIIIPVILFAGIPVIIFALLQFPFLVELYTSTFRPGIFDRNKKKDAQGKGRYG